ncbi:hypothetical protein ACFWPK_23055 [Nocardia sp. NPDC058519]|uniref:hypothetical protein n=1 Tax=Nocardia sp. NPDC058519 TaxID=3346535 RepID=UPI00365D950F
MAAEQMFGYSPIDPPRRFRLTRANGDVVETQLIGTRIRIPDGVERGNDGVDDWKVRLLDQTEHWVRELGELWGETVLGTPDVRD